MAVLHTDSGRNNPAIFIGSLASKRVSFIYLNGFLAVLIAIAAVRIWVSILWR